jgi:hypothetical protein
MNALRESLIFMGVLLLAVPGQAQRVSGIVRDSASGGELPGAVVILTSAQNETLARTLSNAAGRYSLPLTPPAARLRVLRLGYRPQTRDLPAGRAAGNITLDVSLFAVPTLLSGVSVVAQSSCPRADDSQSAAALWDQARSALLASVVAREAKPARVTNLTYERALLPADSQVVYQNARIRTGRSTRSFVAARAPSEMNRSGYTEMGPAGLRFDIPDAEVLLDDSFAATHCFHVSRDEGAHAGEVGLAFEPAPHRDELVDVRGVLWFEPKAPALRSLTFRYTHLEPTAMDAGAGGTLHFQTMSNGVVVISDWMVMLPALEQTRGSRRSLEVGANGSFQPRSRRQATTRVAQLRETGGVLLKAVWPDSVEWDASLGSLSGRVLTEGTTTPLPRVLVTLAGSTDTVLTDERGRFQISPVLDGRYTLKAVDTSYSFMLPARTTSRDISIAPGAAANLDFTLPSRAAALASACPVGDAEGARAATDASTANARQVSLLVGRVVLPAGVSARGLRLTGRWQAGYVLAGNSAAIKEDGGEIELDDSGRFVLCHVARLRPVMLQLSKAYSQLADTLVLIPGDSLLWSVEWHPTVTSTMLAGAAPATFGGTVHRASDGSGVVGADVWLPALNQRTTTDSAGGFSLGELPAGPTLVQIRRVGYLVERDTLTLSRGQVVKRDYVLNAQATMLDTVRTVADRTRYNSSRLQQFETRRAAGNGQFIAEDVFRGNDDRNLTSVILSRMAGLSLVPASRGGGAYLVSTRKRCANSELLSGPNCMPCFVTIYLDGTPLYDASRGGNAPPPDATRFQNSDLAAAEYYAGGSTLPAGFGGTGSGCGTLLLWTRER